MGAGPNVDPWKEWEERHDGDRPEERHSVVSEPGQRCRPSFLAFTRCHAGRFGRETAQCRARPGYGWCLSLVCNIATTTVVVHLACQEIINGKSFG